MCPLQILQISLAFVIYFKHVTLEALFFFFLLFHKSKTLKKHVSKPFLFSWKKHKNKQRRQRLDFYPICLWKTETINVIILQIPVALLRDIFVLHNVWTPR